MVKQIIPANWYQYRKIFKKDGDNFLNISEFYCDTIQGEGIHIGHPAAFLRLQGCTLDCSYCDTKEVWRYGSPYTFNELFKLMDHWDLPSKLKAGQHLVITGGSPLLQQERLCNFIEFFFDNYDFYPFIEIENECVIEPHHNLVILTDCWNNSPKLTSSGVDFEKRYKPKVIKAMSLMNNSWFKFVISSEIDWDEIDAGFLMSGLIKKEQIILMPEGATTEELIKHRELTVELSIRHGVRYSTREHIVIWSNKIGV